MVLHFKHSNWFLGLFSAFCFRTIQSADFLKGQPKTPIIVDSACWKCLAIDITMKNLNYKRLPWEFLSEKPKLHEIIRVKKFEKLIFIRL